MSEEYPWLTETQFPDALDNFDRFSDPTINDLPYIQQYYSYIQQSDLNNASRILEEHPELNNKIVNASNLNKMVDGLNALEYFFTEEVEGYLADLVQYQGAYSASTQYTKYNVVLYNNMSYMYINNTASTGNTPTNTTYWIPLTVDVDKVFFATYGTTTSAQIETAYQSGKIIYCIHDNKIYLMTYRSSSVFHQFTALYDDIIYYIACSGDTWLESSTQLASQAFVNNSINNAKEVFVATYGTTTSAQIESALIAGKIVVCWYMGQFFTLVFRTATKYYFSSLVNSGTEMVFTQIVCDSDIWGEPSTEFTDPIPIAGSRYPVQSGGVYSAINATRQIFIAEYGVTTILELEDAYQAGKFIVCVGGPDDAVFPTCYRETSTLFYFLTTETTSSIVRAENRNGTWSWTREYLAPIVSPSLQGTPLAPTAAAGTNNYQIATTAFVNTAVSAKQDILTFDNEPTSGSNNPVKSGGVYTQLGTKAPLASPALTGTPTAPTATAGTNTTQIATTAFVMTAISNAINNAIGGSY